MLLNLTWLIPGLPIIAAIFITFLLLSFSKTMNRLTKPVSYFIIISLSLSEIINFVFIQKDISGNDVLFGSNYRLFVDRPALIFAESVGFLMLLIMIFSLFKLERRNGYVRYFIFLGLLSGLVFSFSFSGNLFHDLYDPLISSLINTDLPF